MTNFAVGLAVALAVSAMDGAAAQQDQHCEAEYKAFLAAFPKKSSSLERLNKFCSSLALVEKHNAANGRWSMGINEFSDWTDDEKVALFGWDMTYNNSGLPAFKRIEEELAGNVDWRSRMPAVKTQGPCASCWAFSAIDVVDFMAGGSHSEQQLVDCSGEGDCGGGWPPNALDYLTQVGSASEQGYPYKAKDGSCHSFKPVATVSDVRGVSGASDIAAALQQQVVSVCFRLNTKSKFMHYHSGVYDTACGDGDGHCVAAVGYASDYWIIRNSWGSGWGQGGYIYFKRGSNLCGIESEGTIAKASGGSNEAAQVIV